jgi:exopolysaccharide biosynthesis WecB/TagA/CpsF family protein
MTHAASTAALPWQDRWRALLGSLVLVHSLPEEDWLVETLSTPQRTQVLAFVNAHAMNSAAKSESFYRAVASADVVVRDGSGMATLLSLLKRPPGLNLNGTDLIPKIIARFAGRPIALFGTEEPYLSRARQVIIERLAPGSTCIAAHGFMNDQAYVALARAQQPHLVVLGMGMPRQEEVAVALRSALTSPCLVVCGGAIIDFIGGKRPRAPAWMRRTGLEWAFRLGLEPRRLFRRYVLGNPLFLSRSLRLAFAGARGGDLSAS